MTVARWFLLLIVIGPLHMAEQMLTSIEEFDVLREKTAAIYALAGPGREDLASVALITIVWTAVSLLAYGLLRGGTSRLVVAALFGLFATTELHHMVEAVAKGGYDAGVVTCIPYALAGQALVNAAWREYRGVREVPAALALRA